MKTIISGVILSVAAMICVSFSSCLGDQGNVNDYKIKVDSIHLPRQVKADTKFDIVFYGTIGFDACSTFKTFNTEISNNEITIEAWGTYDDRNKLCPEQLVLLDGKTLSMTLPKPGVYRIMISEPIDVVLVAQVTAN